MQQTVLTYGSLHPPQLQYIWFCKLFNLSGHYDHSKKTPKKPKTTKKSAIKAEVIKPSMCYSF